LLLKEGKMKAERPDEIGESLAAFGEEFGKVLDPVAFLSEKNPELCAAFLRLHELTLNEGAVSKKHKFLIHAAITAAQHDREATTMHITGALRRAALATKNCWRRRSLSSRWLGCRPSLSF
jgi:alkylhydroperoxidase/carboxymuconolactone decarboxylase family protein YurZ